MSRRGRGRRHGQRTTTQRPRRRPEGLRPVVELMERRQLLATIRVTSLADAASPAVDAQVTLREAIASINAGTAINSDVAAVVTGAFGSDDRIVFDGLAGTINLVADLPTIARAVVVDGRTGQGFAGTPVITVDGGNVANNVVSIAGPDVVIRSLAIVGGRQSGVLINADAPRALILGNHIGVNAAGTAAMPNVGSGVQVAGALGSQIGGPGANEGNLISGNGGNGIDVRPGSSGTVILGNRIGTNALGTAALGNELDGIQVAGAQGVTIGGGGPSRNLISGNRNDGVQIQGGARLVSVLGNDIGTNASGTAIIGNADVGVFVLDASDVFIGGNLISGNFDGVRIRDDLTTPAVAASGVRVIGNAIGTDRSGTMALGNRDNGVQIDAAASRNTIGGVGDGPGNLISGNGSFGVVIGGDDLPASANVVLGNRIGTNSDGSAALANRDDGVLLASGSVGNTIGGVNASAGTRTAGNLVSGNLGSGVRLLGAGTSANVVIGNFIGTDAAGTIPLGNAVDGVRLEGVSNNTIGGVTPAGALRAGNLVSGNARNGIRLTARLGPQGEVLGVSSANAVFGNFVGTNADGSDDLANGRNPTAPGPIDPNAGLGILIERGSSGNTIGAGNLVSGNVHSGIVIDASPGNLVTGSRVGTDAAGTASIGNGIGQPLPNGATDPTGADAHGILIRNNAADNTIGGVNADPAALTAGNLVSGSVGDGITVRDVLTTGTVILGNRIGTNAAGTAALGNQLDGVQVIGAQAVTIGGAEPGRRNLISGNGSDGIELERGAHVVFVAGNDIGTNAAGTAIIGNADVGVSVLDAADILIADNLISGNFDGVRIRDDLSTPAVPTSGVLVFGNFIGTDRSGAVALGNRDDGVQIVASSGNTVGGVGQGRGNLISGNGSNGVVLGGDALPASANAVLGNRIGTNAAGNAALGNGREGVLLASGSTGNTIGGVNASAGDRSAGNLISGNGGSGVRLLGENSSGNQLLGNFIGTNAAGDAAVGNAVDGVRVEGRPSNTIGGTNATAGALSTGNLISGNSGAGIRLIGDGASANIALGNFIGTDAPGGSAIGNAGPGVAVDGAASNTIGASNGASGILTAGNLVSGNLGDGVALSGPGASANVVVGNFIGTVASGSAALGNEGAGVRVAAPSNAIGGPGVGNVISGNRGDGLAILGDANTARGNLIGTNAGGNAALGNGGDGVAILDARSNTLGGSAAGVPNVIAANAGAGVRLRGANAALNVVAGNRIGTDLDGSTALGNAVGVQVTSAPNNAIGDRNVISGNRGDGVRIEGAGSTAVAVAGNFIGLAADGTTALGNGGDGVRVEGASGNTIASNVVSANAGAGVVLSGSGASANVVRSNRVGTDDDGRVARGNAGGGLVLANAPGNVVGGLAAAEGNIVSGNAGTGIALVGAGTSGNLVAGNVVGADATGDAALGNGDGVVIDAGASANTLGGTTAAAGNLVSGNRGDGVVIGRGASGNLVSGNLVGTTADGSAALGNAGTGVRISDAAGNTLGGRSNLISGNGAFGVAIAGAPASGNVVAGNLIGTDLAGTVGLGVQQVGLVILGAPANRVSGGNLIAGHSGDGLQLISAGASGNLIDGNLIGTDESGRGGLGNARGVFLGGARNTTIRANTVAGNRGDGIVLLGGASGNVLEANFIGLAGPSGNVVRPNVSGVLIVGADANTLDANVIGGNTGFGVALAGTSGNVLTSNAIGVDRRGDGARPNALHGVMVLAASDNTLSRNVISANGLFGVELRNGSSNNVLSENFIGTDRNGTVALGNGEDGVRIDLAGNNRLERNVISGNGIDGVKIISDSPNNVLVGNLIGTNADGNAALGNRGSGILIAGASANALQGNVTSGNAGFGIGIAGAAGNVINEAFVGTDRTGNAALGNGLIGVLLLNAQDNFVLNSVVSANGAVDARGNIRIDGPGASGNLVSGNRIGTDAAGTRSLDPDAPGVQTGNPALPGDGTPSAGSRDTFDPRNDGVVIAEGASANTVGAAGGGQGNLISGNRIGVYIRGQSARNVVANNFVGTTIDGSAALPNGDGVIVMNSSDNTIGGTTAGDRNIISGNLEVGVRLTSIAFDEPRAPASGNVVAGNFIGTDAAGTAALGNRQGVFVYGASSNRIGLGTFSSAGAGGNVLSGNREVGVQILNADTINASTVPMPGGPAITPSPSAVGAVSSGNVVAGNRVGTNAAGTARVPNFQGVFLADAPGNAVVDNLISGNVQVGLNVFAFNAVNNFIGGNRIGPDVLGNVGALANGFGDPAGLGSGLFLDQVLDGANTIAPTNDIRGNAGQQIRVRSIASGPFVESVTPILDPTTGALTRVDVRINGYLDRDASRTLNPSNYALAPPAGGGPVGLASVTYDEVARLVSITPAAPLPAGSSLRLTLVGTSPGGLRSRPGVGIAPAFLDGNVDSRAGDNFVQVINVPSRAAAALLASAVDALAEGDDLP